MSKRISFQLIIISFFISGILASAHSQTATRTRAQTQTRRVATHELAPTLGFYAPDRYETSLAYGIRYYYNIDRRFGVGAVLGFARAKQDFVRRVSNITLQGGSDRVVYHGARATQSFPAGKIEPYLIFHIGLTRLYSQNSFTFGFGLGTKVMAHRRFALRYEFNNYLFTSGRSNNAWTNKNLEMALVLGYYL
ncbi:MAG: outer membrane beta-barrel protein [candidate division KSB1 bacterium]